MEFPIPKIIDLLLMLGIRRCRRLFYCKFTKEAFELVALILFQFKHIGFARQSHVPQNSNPLFQRRHWKLDERKRRFIYDMNEFLFFMILNQIWKKWVVVKGFNYFWKRISVFIEYSQFSYITRIVLQLIINFSPKDSSTHNRSHSG